MTAPESRPVVEIALREIYERVVALGVKVDVMLSQHSDASKDITDHETRLRALERNRWPLPTLTVLVAVAALVVSIIRLG